MSSAVGLWVSARVHSYVTIAPGATESSRFSAGLVPSGYKAPEETQDHACVSLSGLSTN